MRKKGKEKNIEMKGRALRIVNVKLLDDYYQIETDSFYRFMKFRSKHKKRKQYKTLVHGEKRI